MRRLFVLSFVAVFALATGCGKKGEEKKDEGKKEAKQEAAPKEEEKAAVKLDPGQEFAFEGATEDLVEVKKYLKEGKPEETTYKCVAAKSYAGDLAGIDDEKVEALVAEVDQVCGFEAPYATGKAAGDKIEAILKKDPEAMPSDCVDLAMALEAFTEKNREKAEYKALKELATASCK